MVGYFARPHLLEGDLVYFGRKLIIHIDLKAGASDNTVRPHVTAMMSVGCSNDLTMRALMPSTDIVQSKPIKGSISY